jgi:predicted nucleic-acid-binding Zn-ribbon protein
MSDRFILTKYRTDCYHCREIADQIITAVPYRAQVVCDHCGATRVFIPRIEDVDATGKLTKGLKYPVWELVQEATCRNCHVTGPHDIFVSNRILTVRCRNCQFTHFYKFDLEYMAGDEQTPVNEAD